MDGVGLAPYRDHRVLADRGIEVEGRTRFALNTDQPETGIAAQIDRGRGGTGERRAGLDGQPGHPVAEGVLIDECPGVPTEVGGDRLRLPVGEETRTEDRHERHGSHQHRQTNQTELEEGESCLPGLFGGVGDQDVDRGAGESQERAGMSTECQWHQQLRRCPADTKRDNHHHREQGRHRAVDADHRGQHRDEKHHENDEPGLTASCPGYELLTRPGSDTGGVDALADDEECGDEEHRGVAETGQGLVQGEDAGRRQSQRGSHRHHLDREPVPDEQGNDTRQHQVDDGGVGHV